MYFKIYGLVNTINHRVFYIGQTRQTLDLRLIQTRYEWRNSKGGRRKHHRITRIYEGGGDIAIIELDRAASPQEADTLEQQHIAYYRERGYNLANTSRGGAGNWGVKRDEGQRRRIARSVAEYHRARRVT